MGLWDKIFGEFIDVIEWTDNSSDTMVYRFERHNNEIKYGAKLTVRESQVAVFVNEGEIADVLGPGMYELETQIHISKDLEYINTDEYINILNQIITCKKLLNGFIKYFKTLK